MKTLRLVLMALVGLLVLNPSASRAAVDFGFFYDELSPYGDWVEVDDYGYCFQPQVGGDWRPYTDGYWADSDEGFVWVSNEPHGWATYHYGRWANVTGRGWVWVPGYEWGPGWVSWRESNNYVGWAPLPPQARWRPQTGIQFGISFGFGDVGPGYYNFIEPRYFGYPRMRDYVLPYDRNVNIIEQTTNITNITSIVNNNQTVIYNNGPNRDFLRQHSERPIRRLNIDRDRGDLTAAQLRNRKVGNRVDGDRYRVVSPKIERAKANAKPKKVAPGRVARKDINDGYARIADKKRADEVRKRIRAQANDPKNQKKNVVAAKPGDRKGQNANNNKKPANAQKRDEVLKRQSEIEKRPKTVNAKQREERERAAQERTKREQLKKQAATAGDRKPGNGKPTTATQKPNKKDSAPGKVSDQNKPKQQQQAKPQNKPKQQQQAKPQNKPKQQQQAKPQSKPKQQQQAKPQNKPKQQQQAKPQSKPKQQQQAKPQSKPKQQQQAKPQSKPKQQQQAKPQNKPKQQQAKQQQKNKPAAKDDEKDDKKKKKN